MDGSGKGHSASTQSHGLSDLSHHHQQPAAGVERRTSVSSSTSSSSGGEGDFIQLNSEGLEQPIFRGFQAGERPFVATLVDLGGGGEASNDHLGMHPSYAQEASPAAFPSSNLREEDDPLRQPPPAQSIARPPTGAPPDMSPDMYRIPSAVFARTKSTAPMEWSVASNESLFSIHMGNNSFSHDQVFLLGKSGELPSYLNSPRDGYGMMDDFPPPPPPSTQQQQHHHEHQQHHQHHRQQHHHQQQKSPGEYSSKEQVMQQKAAARTVSTPRHSDGSVTSIQSFAFPILTGDRGGSIKVDPQLHQHHLNSQQIAKAQQEEEKGTAANPEAAAASAAPAWCPSFLKCAFCCRPAPAGD